MWNVVLKPNMIEGRDFVIISTEMWSYLSRYIVWQNKFSLYQLGPEIRRDSSIIDGKRIVNVHLWKLLIIPLFSTSLARLATGSGILITGNIYVSPNLQLSRYIELLEETLDTVFYYIFNPLGPIINSFPVTVLDFTGLTWTIPLLRNLYVNKSSRLVNWKLKISSTSTLGHTKPLRIVQYYLIKPY
jgi:hypothetical protein